MGAKRGIDCAVLYNTAHPVWDTPIWVEIDCISDAAPKRTWEAFRFALRRSKVMYGVKTTLDLGFTGTLLNDPDDPNWLAVYEALQDADATMDLLIMDGVELGAIGVRMIAQIISLEESQNPGDVLLPAIEIVPYPDFANKPSWAEVTSAGPPAVYTFTPID